METCLKARRLLRRRFGDEFFCIFAGNGLDFLWDESVRGGRKKYIAFLTFRPTRLGVMGLAAVAARGAATGQENAITTAGNHILVQPGTKITLLVAQMRQPDGTTIQALSEATGWQKHSVRGAISGTLRAKMGLNVQTEVKDGIRHYRIVA